MSREEDFKALLEADDTLMAILTGGIFTSEEIGIEGIRRTAELTAGAFDENGVLKPCAVITESDLIPYDDVRSLKEKVAGTTQMVWIFFHEFRDHDAIDAAKQRTYALLEGERLSNSYPLMWEGDTGYFAEMGPIANSTTVRQSWRVVSIKRAA